MADDPGARVVDVLLVEDDPGDVVLVREAFKQNKVRNETRVASDGVFALEQLRDPNQTLPDLILLDLNLPRMDGRELLAEIRADARLTHIPVLLVAACLLSAFGIILLVR